MKTGLIKFSGFVFLIIGVVLVISSLSGITGFVVLGSLGGSAGQFLGAVLLLGGIVLLALDRAIGLPLEQEVDTVVPIDRKTLKLRREIEQSLRSGRVGTYRELHQLAAKLGYSFVEGEHTNVYHDKHLVTEIPRHKRGVATGTYRSILQDLYKESESAA